MADLRFNVTAETRAATAALGAFAQDVQKKLVNAVRALPNIELTADSTDAQREMKRLRDELAALANKRVGIDIDAGDALAEMSRLQSELRTLGGSTAEVGVRADVAAAEAALGDVEAEIRRLNGTDAEVEVTADTAQAESKLEGFSDKAKAGASAVGVAAGALLAEGLARSMEFGAATAKLEAQLGGSGPVAANAGEIAGGLYANAYGESLGEVGDAVSLVIRSGALMEGATNEQISSITGKVMSLAQAFDQDLGGTINAVGQMVKTGMAKDADEALDILTRGFQEGNDKAGDLLDTFNEYGGQFQKLGVEGPTAMGLISQGLKGGARDADIVADAFKEFSIRAIDGSELTGKAFADLGLDAKDMSDKIAAGGPPAAAALDLTLDRLRNVEDPADRAAIAVGLFGTQSEDLGAALFALDPSTAVLDNVAGAAGRVDEALGGTAQAKVDGLTRGFEQWAASMIETEGPIGDVAAKLQAFGPMVFGVLTAVAPLVLALKMGGVASAIRSGPVAAVDEVGNASDRSNRRMSSGLKKGLLGLGAGLALGAIAKGVDEIGLAAAGSEEGLTSMGDNLHDIVGAGEEILSLNFSGIFSEVGSEWDDLVNQFETGTSLAGGMWADFQREISGFELTEINIDVEADPSGAAASINGLMSEINSSGAEVNINGNANPAGFALRTILQDIAAGKETVMINGEPMPALEALDYVKGLINSGAGEVMINGNPVPAGEALAMFLGQTDTSVGMATIDAKPDPATGKLTALIQMADGSTGTVTLDGNPMLVNGKTVQAVQFADGSRGYITLDGNPNPVTGKIDASVRYGNGSTTRITVDGNPAPLNAKVGAAIAYWNGRQIDINIGGSRVTAGGGVFGYAGGGVAGFAGGGVRRASSRFGMVLPGYAPGVDSEPTLMSRGESVLVPELTRLLGARRILRANAEASGGRPATVVGEIASLMDGIIPRRAADGWVPDDDSFAGNSYHSKNRGKAGAVQAEDGSWVAPGFYGGSGGGTTGGISTGVLPLGSFHVTARAMAGGGIVARPAWVPDDDSFAGNSYHSPNRGKPGAIQAEDGSWVMPSFYAGSGAAARVTAAVRNPAAAMRTSSGTVAVVDAALRAEVQSLRRDMATATARPAELAALRSIAGLLASRSGAASAAADAQAGLTKSVTGAW